MVTKNNLFGAANRFISLGIRDNNSITPMKLQKLLYFTHAKLLQNSTAGLSKDLKFEAWEYGPVDKSVYQLFKEFSSRPIDRIVKFRKSDGAFDDIIPEDNIEQLINEIWTTLGKYSATQLSLLSHRSGSPWATTYKPGIMGLKISNSSIRNYYSDAEKFSI